MSGSTDNAVKVWDIFKGQRRMSIRPCPDIPPLSVYREYHSVTLSQQQQTHRYMCGTQTHSSSSTRSHFTLVQSLLSNTTRRGLSPALTSHSFIGISESELLFVMWYLVCRQCGKDGSTIISSSLLQVETDQRFLMPSTLKRVCNPGETTERGNAAVFRTSLLFCWDSQSSRGEWVSHLLLC